MPDLRSSASERLSPRQMECLRLVYQRKTSKEIAAVTGLAAGTVDTYIAEAVAALGAHNRRQAAEILHSADPGKVEPQSSGVFPATIAPSSDGQPERRVGWADMLPLRRQGSIGNDLNPLARIVWIILLAVAVTIGFGMLAVGADVLSRLFERG